MSAAVFPGFVEGGLMTRDALDAMTLPELCARFDAACEEARHRGLWLWERNPDFSAYCMDRIPHLARLAAGEARRGRT